MAGAIILTQLKLKDGVTPEAYEQWAVPNAAIPRNQPSIRDWRLVRAQTVFGSDAAPPFDFVEIVEVADLEQFGQDVQSAPMQQLQREVAERADLVPIFTQRVG